MRYSKPLIKEVRNYTEAIYFGLNARQLFGAVVAAGTAVSVYFVLKDHMDEMLLSWICVLAATPGALFGFFKFQGLFAEQFLLILLRYIFSPKKLIYESRNIYAEQMEKERGGKKHENIAKRRRV